MILGLSAVSLLSNNKTFTKSNSDLFFKIYLVEGSLNKTSFSGKLTNMKFPAKCLFINKAYRIGEVILFVNKAKNTGIATLWRVFLTKLTSKRTRLNVLFISEQTL
ncbi:MAG: hypothetical protein KAI99_00580, partial [Cyclobacteriaceae bacterium]|nr:hypothetical protein [Cyclobacteriaceae bacterium]